MEVWKEVKDYPSYEVSNYGRVRNVKTGLIRKAYKSNNGYACITLHGKFTKTVHRLVANAFIPNPDPDKYSLVLHNDSNKMNPRADNLRWGNHSENIIDAYNKFERNDAKLHGLWDEIVAKYIDSNGKHGSVARIAREYNCDRKAIYMVLSKTGTKLF